MPLRGYLLLAFILPSLPVCLIRPFYGIVMWTIVSFTSLQWYAYSARIVPVALLVAIFTIIGAFAFARGWRNLFTIQTLLLLALWAWFGFTTVSCGEVPLFADHVDDAWVKLGFVSKILLMAVIAVPAVDSFERLRNLVRVIAGCFGFFVLKSLPFLIFQRGANRVYGPERSMIADNNDFGLALNMTMPLFFFLAQTESRPWVKRLFWGLTLATVPTIFFTYSRGALVGLIAVTLAMALQMKRKAVLVPVILAGVVIAVIMAPQEWKNRMDPTRKEAMDGSAYSRINAWTFCWRLAKDYPLTGGGFETFTPELFLRYAPNAADVHGPHSVYFGILAEHGFIGLGLYLSLIIASLAAVRRTLKWARLNGDEMTASYANMFCFSLVGFLVSGLFLGRQYFDYLYTIIACIVVLKRVAPLRQREIEEPPEASFEEEPDAGGLGPVPVMSGGL